MLGIEARFDTVTHTFATGEKQLMVSGVQLRLGVGLTVRVPDPVPVHPFVSVTVTEYGPAVLVLIVDVVALVLHRNDFDPVPPEGVAVNVAGKTFEQTETSPTETVGFGSIVRVPEPDPVQPFVSVTVTE